MLAAARPCATGHVPAKILAHKDDSDKGLILISVQTQQNLQRAFQLLQSGQIEEADKLAGQICVLNPNSADAAHLLALCRKAKGDVEAAEQQFRKAVKLDKRNFQILCNFANFLSGIGHFDEALEKYQKTVKLNPKFLNGWAGMGTIALTMNKSDIAEKAYREIIKQQPDNTLGWHGLGSALRQQDRLFESADAFEKAVIHAPQNTAAWINLGVVRRMLGELDAALVCFDKAEAAGFKGPELLDGRASVYLDQSKVNESVAIYHKIAEDFPHYTEGYDALARILYENDPDADAPSVLRTAIAGQKENKLLHFKLIRLLYDMKRYDEALASLKDVRALGDDPVLEPSLIGTEAAIRESLGENKLAGEMFEKSLELQPNDVEMIQTYVCHLIRSGDIEKANEYIGRAVRLDPNHQAVWGYQGTIWRLMDDEREHWLHDYDNYVKPCVIDVPDGFSSLEEFCKAVEMTMRPLHVAKHEPADQSLRRGSQTSGNLFGLDDPMIIKVKEAITRTFLKQIKTLPDDPSHPLLRRKTDLIRFAGAWSVLLKSSGHHINHVHSRGWLSSAFYLLLPPSVEMENLDREGWIQFGQPPLDLGLDLEPRTYVKPQVGSLALFPSYTWHGTVPFTEGDERMTIAYDVVPG